MSLSKIWHKRERLAQMIGRNRRLSYTTKLFTQYPMISDFVAYEFTCDLRHTNVLRNAHDIYTWANPGPGAVRGLSRLILGGIGQHLKEEQAISFMRELLEQSPLYLADFMPQLEMRDIEHTLCEFDKYMRIKRGEGRPRAKFTPHYT